MCQCNDNYYFNSETGSCDECHYACKKCTSPIVNKCLECREDFFEVQDSTICVDICPSGFSEDSDSCTGTAGVVSSFEFTSKTNFVEGDNNVSCDIVGPLAIYKRGLWFDGMDDQVRINNLRLHHTHTLQFWVNIYNDGTIYSLTSHTNDYKFRVNGHFFILTYGEYSSTFEFLTI